MPENTQEFTLSTSLGQIRGLETDRCRKYLGVPYAHAGRFEYAVPVDRSDGLLDARAFGPCTSTLNIRRGGFTNGNTGNAQNLHTMRTARISTFLHPYGRKTARS